ncbi:hypothetical protein [Hoeflea sp. AS16]|uniref:hypothetical protein n=1 Tax=Hoeflea sp. AS16 TaxID=3135779 RepID=UPI00317CD984
MVDYTPHTRPGEQGRPHEHVRETTVVRSGNSTGALAALVLLVLLGIAGFVFWTADENVTADAAAPGAEVNQQVAPAAEPARPVPAPDAPLIAPDAAAPANPDGTASPAPATNG